MVKVVITFYTRNSSLEGGMKLKLRHSAPIEMPFPMKSLFAKIKFFIFRPKTMDYNPWCDFWSPKKVLT